ncbi:methionine adenosyltransferase [Candidatus Woesebacteria bacterium RIFCSPHIGHO2_01_FULL_44_21]|uniref:Methionine adenosyltransferase n=1 Tax=Candidatus Woesebacteria bacterium RIFCSPHIGHO2_01_FULL_44_21 TaxID=1802503 RepID=A0A1F7YUW8_9BACT|nr:MAG: methionine adenosyltransferase [Candidatus Woesebacteria bacterium RIFCSPHIGHO2_01_FULL_44_21]OGM69568.1 MAG: methionine adenosyltransferase [Candidatus Woesebacteria bacterium RIFCSPLOWO2_01_FULL_44_24b]
MKTYFTSESVAAGHPDKLCDQISDSIVDAALAAYAGSRVAVETLVTENRIVLAGEVSCPKSLPYAKIARQKIKALGYTGELYNFSYKSPVSVYIHQQSPDIAVGVDNGGAGDQGMMFGYASNETPELMPLPIALAHKLVAKMDEVRDKKILPFLRPDGKSEVKVRYKNGKPESVEMIILAVPHDPKVSPKEVKAKLIAKVIKPVLAGYKLHIPEAKNIVINGTGKWEIGGPASDTGVTGRKIIVDTYGGMARHGGGCFSGKDPSKVDRSGAYACRFLAKNIVAAKLAERCEMRIAYVIGKREPVDIGIECFGTQKKSLPFIRNFAKTLLDLSVAGIIDGLKLRQPIYARTAVYGHFGREEFPWEKVVV